MSEGTKRNFIAEVLSAQRKLPEQSCAKLGREIGCDPATIERLSRGAKEKIRIVTIQKLAKYFQWTVEEVGMAVWYSDQLDTNRSKKIEYPRPPVRSLDFK